MFKNTCAVVVMVGSRSFCGYLLAARTYLALLQAQDRWERAQAEADPLAHQRALEMSQTAVWNARAQNATDEAVEIAEAPAGSVKAPDDLTPEQHAAAWAAYYAQQALLQGAIAAATHGAAVTPQQTHVPKPSRSIAWVRILLLRGAMSPYTSAAKTLLPKPCCQSPVAKTLKPTCPKMGVLTSEFLDIILPPTRQEGKLLHNPHCIRTRTC